MVALKIDMQIVFAAKTWVVDVTSEEDCGDLLWLIELMAD